MTASFPITGVPSEYKTPGVFAEINFAQGAATASVGRRAVVLVMPKTSSGTWTANTLYRIRDEKEARDGAGVGSPLHRAARLFLKANKRAPLWAVPYAATSGTGAAAADLAFTFSGTASAAGTATITVCGEESSVSYKSGDGFATPGQALVSVINSKEHLPCTAAWSSPDVILTARIAGESQGDGTVGVIRARASVTPGTTLAVAAEGAALGLGTGTDGDEGTTTETANLTAALAVLDPVRRYYVVTSDWRAASLTELKTHIASKSEPNPGLRSVGICGYTHTLASGQTLATGKNYERLAICHQINSEHDPAELGANLAAVRQKREEVDSAWNFDGYRGPDWLILPAYDVADWPDGDDMNDAITDGLTLIGSDDNGSFIVESCTTRSKNAGGTVDDPRVLETHRVSVADEFVDEQLSYYALNYSNKKLKDDETLPNGDVNTNQNIPPNTVTPSTFKPWIQQQMRKYGENGKLQNVQDSIDGLAVVRDPNNGGRLQVAEDLEAIDLLHQCSIRVSEVSSG